MTSRKIGFVGFGEAGYHLAKGLSGAGAEGLVAFDLHTHTPGRGEKIVGRARDAGVSLLDSPEALASGASLLLSVVTADAAEAAARAAAAFLGPSHCYLDLNSVAPAAKQSMDRTVSASGARFVEGAIMSPVPPHGHRVPILLGGPHAPELVAWLAPLGMRLEALSGPVGGAAAVKMCRSIIVKGLESLMLECALAACRYEADERVFSSLAESFPGIDWGRLASYMVSRVVLHGERRAREMDEVAGMLAGIGLDPIMASASARRQDWCARLDVREALAGEPPEDYKAIVQAIQRRLEGAS